MTLFSSTSIRTTSITNFPMGKFTMFSEKLFAQHRVHIG